MKIETMHTRPTSMQADPDAETLPMPLAGNDIVHEPQQPHAMAPAKKSMLGRSWCHFRETVADLPLRAKKAREQGAHYVAEEPFRAITMAAAGGATLAILLRAAARHHRH
ncbi:hypothetical protein [Variovorax sp. KK3]|uniref:hypothetical protein n=1 Tax=Variovorax sp. KK3 TaxID=1855728 RepID=UPI00097C1F33|nr:hypothetical protein [Variovorax sp. KK3]